MALGRRSENGRLRGFCAAHELPLDDAFDMKSRTWPSIFLSRSPIAISYWIDKGPKHGVRLLLRSLTELPRRECEREGPDSDGPFGFRSMNFTIGEERDCKCDECRSHHEGRTLAYCGYGVHRAYLQART